MEYSFSYSLIHSQDPILSGDLDIFPVTYSVKNDKDFYSEYIYCWLRVFDRFDVCILKNYRGECGWNYMIRPFDFANYIVSTTFPRLFFRMHSIAHVNSVKHV